MSAEPAVDKDQELNVLWPSKGLYCGQSSPYAAPGIQHVVNKDHILVVNYEIDVGGARRKRVFPSSKIVSVKGDV